MKIILLRNLLKKKVLNVSTLFKKTNLHRQNVLRKLNKGQELNEDEAKQIRFALQETITEIKKITE